MKHKRSFSITILFVVFMLAVPEIGQSEDYSLQYEVVRSSSEAAIIVRHGDIDNMGFGWPEGFDLFSGESTPSHSYPWEINPADATGTDRIMVVSSYGVVPLPCGSDGYTSNTSRPENQPQQIQIQLPVMDIQVQKALLQIFVDDFQPTVWCGQYEVTINGMRVPELEQIINSLNQTGPVGKLITFQLPDYILSSLKNSRSLSLFFDDTTTGAGDGFAFDFFRILFNPKDVGQKIGSVMGTVYDAKTSRTIANAKVSVNEMMETTSNADGFFELFNVPAGLAAVTAVATGYEPKTETVDVVMDGKGAIDFYLLPKEQIDTCDLKDSDSDGVIDLLDKCSNTPANSYVDRYGCPNSNPNTSECNEEVINQARKEGYEEGYKEGKIACTINGDNPTQCEQAILGQNMILHVPMIKYDIPLLDSIYIWADLQFAPMDNKRFLFELINYGVIK